MEVKPIPYQRISTLSVAKLKIRAKSISAVGIKGPDDFKKQILNHLRPCSEKGNGQRKINDPILNRQMTHVGNAVNSAYTDNSYSLKRTGTLVVTMTLAGEKHAWKWPTPLQSRTLV